MTINWTGPPLRPPGRIAPNGLITKRPEGGNLLAGEYVQDFDTPVVLTDFYAGAGVTRSGGRLVLACTPAYSSAKLAQQLSLQNSSLSVEVPVIPAVGAGTTEFYVYLWHSAGNQILIWWGNGTLNFRLTRAGTNSDTSVAYNATTMRYLRFVHDGSNILFDTSPDGLTWTNRRTASASLGPADLSNLSLFLESGYFGTETSPGNTEFDNINTPELAAPAAEVAEAAGVVEDPAPSVAANADVAAATATAPGATVVVSVHALTDDFNDNSIDTGKWTANTGAVTESGGTARCPTTSAYTWFQSSGPYNLAESSLIAKIPVLPALGNGSTEVRAYARSDDTHNIAIGRAGDGSLWCQYRDTTNQDTFPGATFAAAGPWVRIRATGGSLYWDTSTDGSTWTNQRTLAAAPAWLDSVAVRLESGYWGTETSPADAQFDDVNLPPTGASPAAEQTSATAAAFDPAAAVTAAAETTSATAAGLDASSAATAAAETTTGTGAGLDASSAVTTEAEAATGTGTGLDAVAGVTTPAETTTGAGAGLDATVSTASQTSADAETTTGTATAQDASSAVTTAAETTTGTAAGLDATVSTLTQTSAPAETTSASATAQDSTTAVTAAAETTSGTGTALDATVSTSSQASAPAGETTGAAVAADPAVSIATAAEAAAAGAVAEDPAGSIEASAQAATAAGAGLDAAVSIAAAADPTGGAGDAPAPAVSGAVPAELATGTGTALAATVSTLAQTSAPAEPATGSGAAADASVAVSVPADPAPGSGEASPAAGQHGSDVPAGTSTAVSSALDASVAVTVPADLAAAITAVFDAVAVSAPEIVKGTGAVTLDLATHSSAVTFDHATHSSAELAGVASSGVMID